MRWSPSMTPVWLRWRAQSISFVAWALATVLGVGGHYQRVFKGVEIVGWIRDYFQHKPSQCRQGLPHSRCQTEGWQLFVG